MHFIKSSMLLLASSAILITAAPTPLRPIIDPNLRRDKAGVDIADGFKRDMDTRPGVDIADGFKRDVKTGPGVDIADGFKRDVKTGPGVDIADGF
ncbi:hypothetical protein N7G274_009689 [Stereocaulon virgatum]|uniref:Uncharacterized protein n=1 Tax=Stereocaulon virgatum TaxID=373712 RepID=A0ABR3ZXX4_9LECA